MLRTVSWGVAAGATLLLTLTGCAQLPGQATTAAAPDDVCGLIAAPVTAALAQQGVAATPVQDGATSGCRWQDPTGSTTVTLTALDRPLTAKDGQTVDVPGVGEVAVVGPGEVSFSFAGRAWDLAVESPGPDEVDTSIATGLVGGLGGGGGQAAPAPATQEQDATVTVTDADGRTTDLRLSTVAVATPEGIDLGDGQTVPLDRVARVAFSDSGDVSFTAVDVTLTDGSTASGRVFVYLTVDGDSDIGAFRQLVSELASVEFRRDTPFVATPQPQLTPWDAATIVVTETTGATTEVPAPSLRIVADPTVVLDNGQSVPLERITRIDVSRASDDVLRLDITLVDGQQVGGGIDAHLPVEGDGLTTTSGQLQTLSVDRGAGVG